MKGNNNNNKILIENRIIDPININNNKVDILEDNIDKA